MKHRILSGLLSLALALGLTILPASALETEEARDLLQMYYVDQLPDDVLEQTTVEGLIAALGDPYTTYMTAEEYQSFLGQVDGQTVVGIGVSIHATAQGDGVELLSVLANSPAQEAGLSAGDRILAVDGAPIASSNDATALIRGEAGTQVTLTIQLHSTGETRDFTLTRKAVAIPIVTYELRDGDVGYIKCDSFGATTADTVQEALEELDDQASVWIMDLRDNPGGTDVAVNLTAGKFATGIMVYMSSADGLAYYRGIREDAPTYTQSPVIVLTSPWSASGAEMFSAAARDHGFGIAIGQRTYGKGVAQLILDQSRLPDLFDGDALKITAYRFYSPDGTTNDTVGVLPTLLISQENTQAAALLLRGEEPNTAGGYLKLELAGLTFYIRDADARSADNRAAFTELLEALPPSAVLSKGSSGGTWTQIALADLAKQWKLDFHGRGFTDTGDSPFSQAIDTLAAYQLISGYEDGTFRPEQTVTRAEFAAMAASALDLRATTRQPFSDVDSAAWYAQGVNAMAAKGFLAGKGDGTFRPDDTITYEEMVTVLASVAAWANLDAQSMAQESLSAGDWGLYHDFSEWARTSARDLDAMGALVGEQQPGDPGTRETAAGLLCAVLTAAHLIWA